MEQTTNTPTPENPRRWPHISTLKARVADLHNLNQLGEVHRHKSPGLVSCSCCLVKVSRFYLFENTAVCELCWDAVKIPPSRHDKPTKKVQHHAPAYLFVYPVLAEIARPMGYALGVHGSLNNDLDLIAVPWTEDAVSAEELLVHLTQRCSVFFIEDEKGNYVKKDDKYHTALDLKDVSYKPHGRRAWSIQLGNGARIDISVWPRSSDALRTLGS